MKKSAIYVRVSTNYQIDKDSLPLQKNDMINYSKFVLGINDYEIFEDASYSGKNIKRPDFQNMMSRIKQGEFSHLLVWKIDRISRNLLDFCAIYNELKDYNWTTKTISDIIRNPFYKGTYRYNYRNSKGKKRNSKDWVLIDDNHIGIISKELWEECNSIMNDNSEKNNGKFRANAKTHIFAGLLKCSECDNSFFSKQGKPYLDCYIPSWYACTGRYKKLGCNQKTIGEDLLGGFVFNYISNIINISNSQ